LAIEIVSVRIAHAIVPGRMSLGVMVGVPEGDCRPVDAFGCSPEAGDAAEIRVPRVSPRGLSE
jgi:hypothetical protein